MRYYVVVILLALSSNAVADQYKDAALRLLIATGVKESFDEGEKKLYAAMKQQVELTQKMVSGEVALGIGKRTTEVQNKFLERAAEMASEYLSWEAHKEELAQAYVEVYSLDELNNLTMFFESDLGRRYLEKGKVVERRLQGMQERLLMAMKPAIEEMAENMKPELEAAVAEDMKNEK